MAIFTMLASLSKPVKACSSRNFHCAGLSSAPSTMPRLRSAGLVCWRRMWVKAEMRKPAVPQAGSQMRWPGCGFTSATIRSMMWRGVRNWPLVPDSGELAQEVLVHVALEVVAVVGGQVHVVDALDDGAERGAVVNLERGAAEEELAGVGEAGQFVEAFDGIADGVEQVVAGERDEVAPGEARPFAGEDAVYFLSRVARTFVLLGEQAQEEQVGNLLDGIHRVVHAARPEDVHELVDLLAKAGGEEVGAVAMA